MITHYAANLILNHIVGRTAVTSLGTTRSYLALSSTLPTAEGTNVTEPSGGNYARMQLGYSSESGSFYMNAADNGEISNGTKEIHFNEASGAWGPLAYACIFNAATGGQLIAWGELGSYVGGVWTPASISPIANSVVVIKPGDLNISIT